MIKSNHELYKTHIYFLILCLIFSRICQIAVMLNELASNKEAVRSGSGPFTSEKKKKIPLSGLRVKHRQLLILKFYVSALRERKSRWAYLYRPDQALDQKMEATLKSTKNPSRVLSWAAADTMMASYSKPFFSFCRNLRISTGSIVNMIESSHSSDINSHVPLRSIIFCATKSIQRDTAHFHFWVILVESRVDLWLWNLYLFIVNLLSGLARIHLHMT